VSNGRAGLAIIDLQGKAKWRKWIGSLEAYPPPPAVAPDGTLAFARYDDENEKATSIWVMNPGRSQPVKLVANAHQPAWVPGTHT
jgi:hypothetical protein